MAENYYEQLYCEVKAKGQGRRLPSFYDFKKNNSLTQALILKRPAAAIGVTVAVPKKKLAVRGADVAKGLPLETQTMQALRGESFPENISNGAAMGALSACVFNNKMIQCDEKQYWLTGNKHNKNLAVGVLHAQNKLSIEAYRPLQHSGVHLPVYLGTAYRRYIEKMVEIGLAAATLSYAKFIFLFNDMTNNNVNFSQRFETMFSFLKKDKLSIGVSERVLGSENIDFEDCMFISTDMLVCPGGNKNYIYLASAANVEKAPVNTPPK